MNGAMEYIRKTYGVPAKRGGRVELRGVSATIKSAQGGRLRILKDGEKHIVIVHPTWEIKYL